MKIPNRKAIKVSFIGLNRKAYFNPYTSGSTSELHKVLLVAHATWTLSGSLPLSRKHLGDVAALALTVHQAGSHLSV